MAGPTRVEWPLDASFVKHPGRYEFFPERVESATIFKAALSVETFPKAHAELPNAFKRRPGTSEAKGLTSSSWRAQEGGLLREEFTSRNRAMFACVLSHPTVTTF